MSPIALPLWPLCQYDAHTTTSRRPGHALSVTIGDLTAMLLWHKLPDYAAWVLPSHLLRTYGVHTTILWLPSAFCCIFGSIPWQTRMFTTHFFFKNANTKRNHDFIQVWIISFQISYNVNHKVINGQYWKLHMIVLFRSSWYKFPHKFPILSSEFLLLVITFFQNFLQIYTTRRSLNVVIW